MRLLSPGATALALVLAALVWAALVVAAAPALAAPPVPAGPGFVLYASGRTFVLSTTSSAPGAPTPELPGHWLLGAAGSVHSNLPDEPPCPATCGGTGLQATPKAPPEPVSTGDDGEDEEEDCESGDLRPASIYGGVLQSAGPTHSGCGGMNIYGYGSVDTPIVPKASVTPPSTGDRWCDPDGPVPGPDTVWPVTSEACHFEGRGWGPPGWSVDGDAPAECESCADRPGQSLVVTVHNGWVVTVWDAVDSSGASRREVMYSLASPKVCPSREDPCGAARRFEKVPGLVVPELPLAPTEDEPRPEPPPLSGPSRFWIASDGSAALVVTGTTWAIYRPGAKTPQASGTLPSAEPLWLGARFHADVAPLLVGACPALCKSNAATADAADNRTAKELGNSCFRHLKAGELATADAECRLAVTRTSDPKTLGAVWFNLGLVAERQGRTSDAREAYTRSLALRPNATVSARLQKLGP